MTARFAGSRSLDERRRRRLAGGSDDNHAHSETTPPSTAAQDRRESLTSGESGDSYPVEAAAARFSISRLISPKLWKHAAVGLLGLLIGGGIIYAGWTASSATAQLGPGFVRLFDLSSGGAARQFCGWLLFLSSQLALLICWVRSRSPRDFDGRYRWWAWCTLIGFAAAVTTSNELHVAWSQTAVWLWNMDFWNAAILVWMLPVSAAAMWLLYTLHREMRDCPSSLTMLWTAAGCGLLAALLTLRVVHFPLSPREHQLLHSGVEMTAHWALFISLLLHARHVVHVTADAAEIRPFPFKLRSLLRWPKFRLTARIVRRIASVAEIQIETQQPAVAKKSPAKPKRKRPPAKVESTPSRPDDPSEDAMVPQAEATEKIADVSEPAVEADTPVESDISSCADESPEPIPFDEPLDKELLKGLSKRERRRLRKQHRDAQRSSRPERRAG